MCNGEYVKLFLLSAYNPLNLVLYWAVLISVVVIGHIDIILQKTKALGDLIWNYGDENDTIAREAFRSAFILGSDDAVYALSNRTSIKAINTGYVSAYNKSYPLLYAAVRIRTPPYPYT